MTDEFDEALDQTTPTVPDEFDQALGAVEQNRNTTRNLSLRTSLEKNPDEFAKVIELSEYTDLSPEAVEEYQSELEAAKKMDDFDRALKDSPTLQRKMADPGFAGVAHDDAKKLAEIETTIRNPDPYTIELRNLYRKGNAMVRVSQLNNAEAMSYWGLGPEVDGAKIRAERESLQAAMGYTGRERSFIGGIIPASAEQVPIQAYIASYGTAEALMYGTTGAAGGAFAVTTGSGGGAVLAGPPGWGAIAAGAATGFVTMAPVGGKIGSFEGAFRLESGLARDEYMAIPDVNRDAAEAMSVVAGGINGMIEFWSFGIWTKTFTPLKVMTKQRIKAAMRDPTKRALIGGLAKRWIMAAGAEGVEEIFQSVTTQMGAGVVERLKDNKITPEEWGELLDQLLDPTMWAGALKEGEKGFQAGLGLGGATTIASVPSEIANYHRNKNAFMREQDRISRITTLAQQSALAERQPETFMQMYREIEEEAEAFEDIYITPEEAAGFLEKEGVKRGDTESMNPAQVTIDAQLDYALETGQDVVIPIEEFATYVARSEKFESLRAHVKLSQHSFTPAEAEVAQKDFNERMESLISRAEENQKDHRQAQKIYTQVEEQLIATGRVTREVAALSAKLVPAYVTEYTRRLRESGMAPNVTVEEVFEKVTGLSIIGPKDAFPGEGETIADQADQPGGKRKLYHVTFSDRVDGIREGGINIFKSPGSNWLKAGDESRYGDGEIFAFDNFTDAVSWAGKMGWDFYQDTSGPNISIIEFDDDGAEAWEIDDADPAAQTGKRGDWLKRAMPVRGENIGRAIPMSRDLSRELSAAFPDQEVTLPPSMETAEQGGTLVPSDVIHPDGEVVEIVEMESRTNTARLNRLLGPQLYGDPRRMASITIKELVQNSFDTVRTLVRAEQIEQGKIEIHLDHDQREITVKDNGGGMDAEILQNAFLTTAGTHKPGEINSGGFGIAKLVFLYGAEQVAVSTVKDGVKYQFSHSGMEIEASADGGPKLRVMRENTDEPNGTTVRVKVPPSFTDRGTGEERNIAFVDKYDVQSMLKHSPLYENVEVSATDTRYSATPTVLDIGANFPIDDYVPFALIKFPWGRARVLISREETTEGWENTHFLSEGLWQFSSRLKENPLDLNSDNLPRRVYVNLEPQVEPEDPGYPFSLDRQGLSQITEKGINSVLHWLTALHSGTKAGQTAKGFGTIQQINIDGTLTDPIDLSPDIDASVREKMLVIDKDSKVSVDEDGRVIVNGQELPELTPETMQQLKPSLRDFQVDQNLIDPNIPMMHSGLAYIDSGQSFIEKIQEEKGERANQYFSELSRVFKDMMNHLGQTGGSRWNGIEMVPVGVSLNNYAEHSDRNKKGYYGVHIRVPFQGMFIDAGQSILDNTDEKNDWPPLLANTFIEVMKHEAAHWYATGHGGDFILAAHEVAARLETWTELSSVRERLEMVTREYIDVYEFINTEIRSELIENTGVQFEDAARRDFLERDAGLAASDASERGADEGREGDRGLPGEGQAGTGAAEDGRIDGRVPTVSERGGFVAAPGHSGVRLSESQERELRAINAQAARAQETDDTFEQQQPAPTIEQAQRNRIGLYSGVEQALLDMNIQEWRKNEGRAKGNVVWTKLTKMPGVKKEEIEWLGLKEFLDSAETHSREEVVAFVQGNGVVVEEMVAEEDPSGGQGVGSFDWSESIEEDPSMWDHRVQDWDYEWNNGQRDFPQWWDSDQWVLENFQDVLDDLDSGGHFDSQEQYLKYVALMTATGLPNPEIDMTEVVAQLEEELEIVVVDEDAVSGEGSNMKHDFDLAADAAAEEEYRDNPYKMWWDEDTKLEIRGNEDYGFTLLHNGSQVNTDEIWSFNEATVQAQTYAYDHDLFDDPDDREGVAQWGTHISATYNIDADNYRERKLRLPQNPGDTFNWDEHFADENLVAFLRETDRTLQPVVDLTEDEARDTESPLLDEMRSLMESDFSDEKMQAARDRSLAALMESIRPEMIKDEEQFKRRLEDYTAWESINSMMGFNDERVSEYRRMEQAKRRLHEKIANENVRWNSRQQKLFRAGKGPKTSYHIEELQSDWHQQGRQRGYKKDLTSDELNAMGGRVQELSDAIDERIGDELDRSKTYTDTEMDIARRGEGNVNLGERNARYAAIQYAWELIRKADQTGQVDDISDYPVSARFVYDHGLSKEFRKEVAEQVKEFDRRAAEVAVERDGVPDVPFKGNAWLQLALKRALVQAAEDGYEYFSWADADAIVERWGTTAEELYRNTYDRKMPSMIKKMTKQQPVREIDGFGTGDGGYWYIELTPELREQIRRESFTLFQRDGGMPRGRINFEATSRAATLQMLEAADPTTFLHEAAHLFLEMERRFYTESSLPDEYRAEGQKILDYIGADNWGQVRAGTDYHEKFASAFEVYLEEGKAPSIELRDAFRRFASWIKQVYRKWSGAVNYYRRQHNMDVRLTPAIREVFDRMLASEEQIEAAEAQMHYDPIFDSAEEAGMDEAGWAEHQKKQRAATDRADETLRGKLLRQLRKRATTEWNDELDELTTQFVAQLSEDKLYQATEFMAAKEPPGKFTVNKMNRKKVYDILWMPEPKAAEPYDLLHAIADKGGINRDEAKYHGVDPAFWRGRRNENRRFFGKPIFRKTGGRGFDEMLEALAEDGWFGSPDPDAPTRFDENDLVDMVIRASNGEEILHPSESFEDMDAQMQAEYESRYGPDEAPAEGEQPTKSRRQPPRQLRGLTVKSGGADPDSIAAIFGFESGHELIEAIVANPTLKQAASEAAERTMVERYGDVLNDGTLEQEADEAAHNEERGAAILSELKALNDKAGTMAQVERKQVRESAKRIIATRRVTSLRPDRYRRAEIKAAKEAQQAHDAGDAVAAAEAKRKQYLNFHLWREAVKVKKEADTISRQLTRIKKKRYAAREMDPEFVRRMKTLLNTYEFRQTSRQAREEARGQLEAVSAWIDQQRDDPNSPPIVESVMLKTPIHYKEMTIEQLRGVKDVVFSLRHSGNQSNAEAKAEWVAAMQGVADGIGQNTIPKKLRPPEQTPLGKASDWVHSALSAHRKMESFVRQLDGFQDMGPLWKLTIKPLLDAARRQLEMQEAAHDGLAAVFKGHEGALRSTHRRRTFILESGQKLTLSLGGQMVVALNWGNESNREAMLNQSGMPMTENDIARIIGELTDSDWDAVEGVWEFIDSYWPQIKELEERMTGVAPPRVEAAPFTLPSGRVIKGGYYPLIGDSRLDWLQNMHDIETRAKQLRDGQTGRAATSHGHTIARVGWGGKAVNLNIDGLFRHIDMVVHDLTHREAVRQVDRVLGAKSIREAMTTALGREAVSSMRNRVAEVAAGHRHPEELNFAERLLRHGRLGLTFGALGFSLKTMFTQVLGLGVAAGEFGPMFMLRGMMDFYSNPFANGRFIKEKSVYMRDRISTMNRDTDAILRQMRGKTPWNSVKEKSFMFMLAGDLFASRGVWWAAYNDGMQRAQSAAAEDTGFETEQDAIDWADRAVARTQQSGMLMDLSTVESRNEFVKAFTVMYSAFNAIYNITTEQTRKVQIGKINKVEYTWNLMWIIVFPALIEEMVSGFDWGGEDEDEDGLFFNRWTRAVAGYSLGTMFLLREVSWMVRSGQASKMPIQRMMESPFALNVQVQQGEVDTAAIRAVGNFLSLTLHVPGTAQMSRTLNYYLALESGEEQDFNPWEAFVIGPRADEE